MAYNLLPENNFFILQKSYLVIKFNGNIFKSGFEYDLLFLKASYDFIVYIIIYVLIFIGFYIDF